MRLKIAAGNWKMNNTFTEGTKLIRKINTSIHSTPPKQSEKELKVVLGVPFILLKTAGRLTQDMPRIEIAAQNCYSEEKGAYTGEISAEMIKSTGAAYVIIGHSERRDYFNESHEMLAKKVNLAIKHELKPIFCCGEKLDVRQKNEHFNLVKKQIQDSLFQLSKEDFKKVVIAYEPVWAIGTGVTASPEQAQEMHLFIRNLLKEKFGEKIVNDTSILYGGSVNAKNAAELFSQPDVDGGLVGGASLKAEDFVTIVKSF